MNRLPIRRTLTIDCSFGLRNFTPQENSNQKKISIIKVRLQITFSEKFAEGSRSLLAAKRLGGFASVTSVDTLVFSVAVPSFALGHLIVVESIPIFLVILLNSE